MASPFYNNIKGTTAGTPGTGAYTPSGTPASTYSPWTSVPAGWMGLVRFEDGSAWSLEYCYWNGTTLSRASTQVDQRADGTLLTSTGSHLSLTSAATAEMVMDPTDFATHPGQSMDRGYVALPSTAVPTPRGLAAITVTGTAATATQDTTSYFNEQIKGQTNSALTANAQAGYSTGNNWIYSTAAGRGGAEMYARWGAATVPNVAYRVFTGWASTTYVGQTVDPSGYTTSAAAFIKDAADTNLQLFTRGGATAGTKTDTGIPFAALGWYETMVWWEPSGGRVFGKIFRLDNGAIWVGSQATQLPANGSLMRPHIIGGVGASAASTAFGMGMGSMFMRGAG